MITFYDTSLRDGLQGEKIALSLNDKLVSVKELDKLGTHFIEGGFPLASENEMKFFEEVKKIELKHSKIVAFGSTKKPKVKPEEDFHMQALLKAGTEVITIVGKSWTRHVRDVIQTDLDENLRMIQESVAYLKSQGKMVIYDAEHFFDGYKEDAGYATETLKVAVAGGADIVVVCDTNGGIIYRDVNDILPQVAKIEGIQFGVHFHNDTESAVSNSILALDHGAKQIQGTMNGWGERCGNTNLTTVMANVHYKTDYKVQTDEQISHLTYVSRYFDELANLPPDDRQAYVGKSAFAHKAGQHADVILKNPQIMEHIDSTLIGNNRRVLLSELAGKASIAFKLNKFGDFDKNSIEVKKLTYILKEKEQLGYEYEAAEASFELMARKELGIYQPIIDNWEYRLDIRNEEASQVNHQANMHSQYIWAFVRIIKEEYSSIGDALSVGPVGALDQALRKAFSQSLPNKFNFIEDINLEDFKVRVINGQDATEAKVRVNIQTKAGEKCGEKLVGQIWGTTGVSTNIIDAAWEALIESFDFAYNEILSEK